MISALPYRGYDPAAYRLRPARVTRALADGDEISLGDRTLTVLHLPGHSPGSIALLDRGNGILFTGDVVYDDDELLDELDGSDIAGYLQTMARLAALPADAVRVVHAGHDASFGRARLNQLTGGYLRARGGRASPASPASSASIASIRTGAGR
jgi:glyoxylase-like metal-dependent hydrolase (beta-lactamase superfamily II)